MVKFECALPFGIFVFLRNKIVIEVPLVEKICCSFRYLSVEHKACFKPTKRSFLYISYRLLFEDVLVFGLDGD